MYAVSRFNTGARVRFKSRLSVPRHLRNAVGTVVAPIAQNRRMMDRQQLRSVPDGEAYRISIGEQTVMASVDWLLVA